MSFKEMGNNELLTEYRDAIENWPAGGRQRQQIAVIEAELLFRMEQPAKAPETFPINKLHGLATLKAIEEMEKLHLAVEGVRPQNVAASIGYAVDKNILFNQNGTISRREGGGA